MVFEFERSGGPTMVKSGYNEYVGYLTGGPAFRNTTAALVWGQPTGYIESNRVHAGTANAKVGVPIVGYVDDGSAFESSNVGGLDGRGDGPAALAHAAIALACDPLLA